MNFLNSFFFLQFSNQGGQSLGVEAGPARLGEGGHRGEGHTPFKFTAGENRKRGRKKENEGAKRQRGEMVAVRSDKSGHYFGCRPLHRDAGPDGPDAKRHRRGVTRRGIGPGLAQGWPTQCNKVKPPRDSSNSRLCAMRYGGRRKQRTLLHAGTAKPGRLAPRT